MIGRASTSEQVDLFRSRTLRADLIVRSDAGPDKPGRQVDHELIAFARRPDTSTTRPSTSTVDVSTVSTIRRSCDERADAMSSTPPASG